MNKEYDKKHNLLLTVCEMDILRLFLEEYLESGNNEARKEMATIYKRICKTIKKSLK